MSKPIRLAALALSLLSLVGFGCLPAVAEWNSDVSVYLWASALNGRVGSGETEAEVDMSFSDILDDLQFGSMAAYSGSNGRWAFQADAVIANLGRTERGEQGIVRLDVDVDMTLLEADLGYEVNDSFRLFAGARYVDLTNEVRLRIANQELRAKGSESWVDPVVGARWGVAGERWSFWLRGDIGGFGVGSDFSWNAVAAVSFKVSDRIRLGAGYRILDIDYEDGTGESRFLYDSQMFGIVSGLIFSF